MQRPGQPPQRPSNMQAAPGMPGFGRMGAPGGGGYPYMGAPRVMQGYPGMPQQRGLGVPPQPSPSYLPSGNRASGFPFGPAASGPQGASSASAGAGAGVGSGTPGLPPHLSSGGTQNSSGISGSSALSGGQSGASGPSGGAAQPNLDLNDFPALGSGHGSGAGGAPGLGNPGAGAGAGAGQSASSLLSSYASQAGTGSANLGSPMPAPGMAGAGTLGGGAGRPGGAQSFSNDDFPALNQQGAGHGAGAGAGGPDGNAGLNGSPYLNGSSSQQSQEQASAAAALQHQHQQREQHRQNLLGSMTSGGSAQSATLSAARGGFGEPDRNYATKLGSVSQTPTTQQQTWVPPNAAFPNQQAHTNGIATHAPQGLPSGPQGLRSPNPDGATTNNAGAPASTNANSGSAGGPGGGSDAAGAGAGGATGTGTGLGEMAQTPAQQVLSSPADRFGLLGLLSVIKMQDPDLSMLAMGSDLQTLGLNLNAPDALYSSFITPWSDNNIVASLQVEPDFHLPSCYNVQPPPPAQSKIASFTDETLFFIFYSTPRDVLQEVAAQELYNRNWRYHKDLHLWLTKEQNTEPTQKTPTYERGNYVFFDPGAWEKVTKNFVLMYELLEEKPPTQAHLAQVQAQAQAHQQAAAHQAQQHNF